MSKGSDRRPLKVSEEAFADNWARIFGSDGVRVGANDGSNPSNVGAIPTTPANGDVYRKALNGDPSYVQYVDDATGKQVSEEWWPGDEVN